MQYQYTDADGITRVKSNYIQLRDGRWVANPTAEDLANSDWSEFVPPEPEPYVPQPQQEADIYEKVDALLKLSSIGTEIVAMDDEAALSMKALFPTYISLVGKNVAAGTRLYYNEKLYRVNQQHIVAEQWKPDEIPALYTEVQVVEWPEYVAPTGAHDAYNQGDKITFNGHHYVSKVNGNIYSPEEYAANWELVER